MNLNDNDLSFLEIRKENIDTLEKNYNELLPKCLDTYKRWKYASVNKTSDRLQLEMDYYSQKKKLLDIQGQLNDINSTTSQDIANQSVEVNDLDKHIFKNQIIIDKEGKKLEKKHVTFETDDIKVVEYTQLINSMSIKNVLLIILLLIVILILSYLIFLYFIKE